MLGWQVFIRTESTSDSNDHNHNIVSWTTGMYGLSWIDELVKEGNAVNLGGDGYPLRYLIKAKVLRTVLNKGLPTHDSPPVVGNDYYLPSGFNSDIRINTELLANCSDDEELVVTAWDLS
jgi:hypothetical protein